jgi:hypothetical protein
MFAEDFDKVFDEGKDVTDFLDYDKAGRTAHRQKRVNIDFPNGMIHALSKN